MKPINAKRERGAALLALLAVIMLAASWLLVSQLSAQSGGIEAVRKARNAEVLNRAKLALIGYVAMEAAEAANYNPGRFPCPEAVNNIATSSEGISAPMIGPPTTTTCSSIGRLPWRTIGVEKLLDSAGEPLWYVVGPTWRLTTSASALLINSNTTGDITVDGQQVVALIIAPGAAMNSQSATGCTAQNQARSAPAASMIAANYIECFTGTTQFVTTAASTSYNDQVVRITVADIMPAIEAAIAKRIERDIVPQLQAVYAGPGWGLTTGSRLYPFAAPFENPGPGALTSKFQGQGLNTPLLSTPAVYQGLLPFNQVDCTASAGNPRCLPGAALTSWATAATAYDGGGWGYIQTQSCYYEAGNAARVCQGEYHENDTYPGIPPYTDMTISGNRGMRIEMEVRLRNVAMGLRAFNPARMQVEARNDGTTAWLAQTVNYALTMNSDGSLTIRFWADLPNIDSMTWGTYAEYRIRVERLVVTDHPLLDPNAATTGWFTRNEWFRLLYYATAVTHTAAQLPGALTCTAGTNCLTVTNLTPSDNKRALLILAGRSLNGTARPSITLSDYLEFANADLNTTFEKQPISRANNAAAKQPFNDRVIVLDSN